MRRASSLVLLLVCMVCSAIAVRANTVTVHVYNFKFSTNPSGQPVVQPTINAGDTIQWVWDSGSHTCTSVKGSAETFDSGTLSTGATFSHTFNNPGTFVFYCKIHGSDNGDGTASGMAGMVTVNSVGPSIAVLSLSPKTVAGSVKVTGKVTLTAVAPAGGSVVTLSSNSTLAKVPASITVPVNTLTKTFTITTTAVTATKTATITATDNGTATAPLTITPITISTITLSSTAVTGGQSVTGTIKLVAKAAPGSVTITFVSNNLKVAPNPAPLTIPAGSQTGTFTITTIAGANGKVTIKCTTGGKTVATKVITVTP